MRLRLRTALIDMTFTPRLSVDVGAGVDRIGQHHVDHMIGRRLPAKLDTEMEAVRKIQLLHHESAPHPAGGPELGEAFEHGADRALDLLVGVEQDLRITFAAHIPDGLAAVCRSPGRARPA